MTTDFQRLALLAKKIQQTEPELTFRQARNQVLSLEQQWQQQGQRFKHLYPGGRFQQPRK